MRTYNIDNINFVCGDASIAKKIYYTINKTNISYSLASTEFISEIISKCLNFSKKHILISGQPRTDSIFYEPVTCSELNKNKFNILYAPTWRQYSPLILFPFDDFNSIKFENFLIEYAPGLGVSIFENDDFNDTLGDLKSLKKILDLFGVHVLNLVHKKEET